MADRIKTSYIGQGGTDSMKPMAESMRDGITDAGNTAAKIFDEAMCLMKLK